MGGSIDRGYLSSSVSVDQDMVLSTFKRQTMGYVPNFDNDVETRLGRFPNPDPAC